MPTYEYECLSCGVRFDAFQKMSESPLDSCIKCQGSVRRVVSGGSGLIFKGSGFYITDYAGGRNKTATSETGASPSKTAEAKPVAASKSEE